MFTTTSIALLISFQAATTGDQTAQPAQAIQTEQTAAVAEEEITDRSHPDFIRCRRDSVVGSRAKKVKRCFTNREWEKIAQAGNRGSRTLVGDLQPGFSQPGD